MIHCKIIMGTITKRHIIDKKEKKPINISVVIRIKED
jgi:hypothetical protein